MNTIKDALKLSIGLLLLIVAGLIASCPR